MTGTLRTVAVPGKPAHTAAESSRWRQERFERVARRGRDEKRVARADRRSARANDEIEYPVGSTVRVA